MSKGTITTIVVASVLVLGGIGVGVYYVVSQPATNNTVSSQSGLTPHNSSIVNGVDQALVGTWQLQSQTVVGQTNPFAGHTLTISANGTMQHDYSTESASDAPDCEVSGSVPATFSNALKTVTDTSEETNDAEATETTVAELRVTRTSDVNPTVECQGAGVAVTSNSPVQPLGTGPSTTEAGETFVSYTYSLNDDSSILTINLDNPPSTYVYKRIN